MSQDALTRAAHPTARMAALVEDATFLADAGVGFNDAAPRLGYAKPRSLERTLVRAGRQDIITALRANNPPPAPQARTADYRPVWRVA